MGNLIETKEIAGGAVYGVKQVTFTVDGAEGRDFADALTAAAFKEATSIEATASAYSAVIRQRQRKVSDLGNILAYLNSAYARLKIKEQEPGDTATVDNGAWVNGTASSYGITLVFKANTSDMTRGNIMKGQNDVQYALDVEDNNLQQDMISLQSFISKRDNAFSTAAQIVKKASKTADGTIGNIRG